MERTPEGWSRELQGEWSLRIDPNLSVTQGFRKSDGVCCAWGKGAAADDADHHPEITVSWGVARVDCVVSRRKRCYVA